MVCVVLGSSSDVSGLGLDASSVDKSRNSFRFVNVLCILPSNGTDTYCSHYFYCHRHIVRH